MKGCVITAAMAVALWAGAHAQAPEAKSSVRIVGTGSTARIHNQLKVPVLVLLQMGGKTPRYEIARVDGLSESAAATPFADATIRAVEPLSARVPRATTAATCDPRQIATFDLAELQASFAKDADETPEGREAIAAAAAMAAMETQHRFEAANAYVANPLRQQLIANQEAFVASVEPNVLRDVFTADGYDVMFGAVGDIAKMVRGFAAAEERKVALLYKQTQNLKPVVKAAELGAQLQREQLETDRQYAAAGAKFLAEFVRALVADGNPADRAVLAPRALARSCQTPAVVEDWIRFDLDADIHPLLMGAVRFDRGGEHPVAFRRVHRTATWIGRVYWPADATRASVSVGTGPSAVDAGTLTTGRPTLVSVAENVRKAAAIVRKKYKETNFRAAGADNVKTVPVPD